MNALPTAIAAAMLVSAAAQDPTIESRAVARVQQTPVSQYDPALPARPFGSWLSQIVGPQSGVTWGLTECLEPSRVASNGEQVIPACVEVTAILPNERKVVAQIIIGSYRLGRLGLSAEARFHLAVVEDRGRFRSAQRLSVLPQLLSASPPKTGLKAITLPVIQATRPLRLHIAASPVSIPPPKMAPVGMELDPPPPRPSAGFRVSKGVSIGDAITRVTPTYPLVARQINAVGEVQVEIVIDETGRVIEAKAISGHTVLRFPAEEAAKRWVFKPTLLDGKPVKQRGLLTFVFTRQQ